MTNFYPGGILYGTRANPYFTSSKYETNIRDDRLKTDNALKIEEAVRFWEEEASRRKDPYMQERVRNFKTGGTTSYEVDVKTKLFFSDPENNVVRLIQVNDRLWAFGFTKPYLDSLDIHNEKHMKELATMIEFGQALIDMSARAIEMDLKMTERSRSQEHYNPLFSKKYGRPFYRYRSFDKQACPIHGRRYPL